jgi:DME family drug/metabolite transporter
MLPKLWAIKRCYFRAVAFSMKAEKVNGLVKRDKCFIIDRVIEAPPNNRSAFAAFHPVTLGILCCALASVSYTVSNICVRKLAGSHVDPGWVVCVKESITASLVVPWLLMRLLRGLTVFPLKEIKMLGMLILVGLAVQLIGNFGFLWALERIGLAINNGTMLLSSAVFAWLIFGEKISLRSALTMGLLLAALVLLGFGAEASAKACNISSPTAAPRVLEIAAAVAVACIAGTVFAVLSIACRRSMNSLMPQSALIFIITSMGAVTWGPICLSRFSLEQLQSFTSFDVFVWMLAAGFFNLLGFLGISKGLQLTTVVHASVLNASQVALAAVAGILLFNEPSNLWLIFGVSMMIVGILFVDRPKTAAETVEMPV